MGITTFCSVLPSTFQHEIDDLDRRLLGCCRRCSPRGVCPHHPHQEPDPTMTPRNKSTLSATNPRTASSSARAESRNRSVTNPKKPESSPRANSLTPKKE